MSKSLLLLGNGSKVSVGRGGAIKEFSIADVVEAEGWVNVTLKAEDHEEIALVFAQKTGKEYWDELQATLKEFMEKAEGTLAEFASDFSNLANAFGELNLTKKVQKVFSGIGNKKK